MIHRLSSGYQHGAIVWCSNPMVSNWKATRPTSARATATIDQSSPPLKRLCCDNLSYLPPLFFMPHTHIDQAPQRASPSPSSTLRCPRIGQQVISTRNGAFRACAAFISRPSPRAEPTPTRSSVRDSALLAISSRTASSPVQFAVESGKRKAGAEDGDAAANWQRQGQGGLGPGALAKERGAGPASETGLGLSYPSDQKK